MSNSYDEQDSAEALDADKLPGSSFEVTPEPEYPLENPLGVEEYGLTSAEEQIPEPIEDSLSRDRSDPLLAEERHQKLVHYEDPDRNAEFTAEEAAMHQIDEEDVDEEQRSASDQNTESQTGEAEQREAEMTPGEGVSTGAALAEPNEPG